MELINRYLSKTEFKDSQDFEKNYQVIVPENFDFARDIVDVWASEEPEKTALIYCTDEDGSMIRFTFTDISRLSKQMASWLTENGIHRGDRVVTMLRRHWMYWIIAVALCRIGAVAAPISIQMKEKDIAYRIDTCKAKALIVLPDEDVLEQIRDLPDKCRTLEGIYTINHEADGYRCLSDEFIQCGQYEQPNQACNTDPLVAYFTSGTSGYPKMAMHNRLYPLGHIITAKYMQCVQNNGLHLTQTDSGWAKFGWGNIYGQWICGTAILAYDPIRFNTKNMMHILQTYRPTTMCVPPTMYRFLLHDGLTREHVESIQWYSTAGEPLSGEVNQQFFQLTGHYIHEGCGQSEGTPITFTSPFIDVRPSSMGKPSPLYHVDLIRPDGSSCDVGETGELVLRVDESRPHVGLLDYYYINGETIYPVQDGIYHTGDTAYKDADGYYWYVGRIDDMIKCSGYRIGPFEIESVLNSHPAVKESAIVGAKDPIRGQIVAAVIVLQNGYTASDNLTRELQKYVKEVTAPYKYPRKIVYVDSLPKTTTGKIVRREAKEYAAKYA